MTNVKSFLIVLFSPLLLCCEHQLKVDHGVAVEDDNAVIFSKVVPAELSSKGHFEKEYFVVRRIDTSAFSFFVIKNLTTGRVSIELRRSEQKVHGSFSIADSVAVREKVASRNISFPGYDTQIEELKLIMRDASFDFDFDSLRVIAFDLFSFPDYSEKLAEKYILANGRRFDNNSSAKVIELMEPSLLHELNTILSDYFLLIEKVSIDGLAYDELPRGVNMLYGRVICAIGSKKH